MVPSEEGASVAPTAAAPSSPLAPATTAQPSAPPDGLTNGITEGANSIVDEPAGGDGLPGVDGEPDGGTTAAEGVTGGEAAPLPTLAELLERGERERCALEEEMERTERMAGVLTGEARTQCMEVRGAHATGGWGLRGKSVPMLSFRVHACTHGKFGRTGSKRGVAKITTLRITAWKAHTRPHHT